MENVILETVKTLGAILIGLIPIGSVVTQTVKEAIGLVDKKAQVLSFGIGFVLSALVAWVYADGLGYSLELGQWVGLGLFIVLGTVSPSGGYKVIGELAGTRTNL